MSPRPPLPPHRVRLVVLNYNGGELVGRCVEHLHRLDWPADDLEVVLVDNASADGSADAVEARFPRVRVIRNATNDGFPANNLGLTDLDDVRYVGLVNPDAFVEPGWLAALVEALDADPGLGAAAPKMLFAPRFVDVVLDAPVTEPGGHDHRALGVMVTGVRVGGEDRWADAQVAEGGWGIEHGRTGPFRWTAGHAVLRLPVDEGAALPLAVEVQLRSDTPKKVTLTGEGGPATVAVDGTPRWFPVSAGGRPYDVVQNAGSMVFDDGYGADRGFGQRDAGQFDDATDVFAWCGGGVLLRPEYVRATGAFDERFFLYYEDTDWAWRGRARGWRYRYVPGAVMRHVHAASSGEGSDLFAFHTERNRLLMVLKNAPRAMVAAQVVRYALVTASYGRRDLVGPLRRGHRPDLTTVRRRLGSLAGFARLVPAMAAARRRLRAAQTVPDAELVGQLVRRQP